MFHGTSRSQNPFPETKTEILLCKKEIMVFQFPIGLQTESRTPHS